MYNNRKSSSSAVVESVTVACVNFASDVAVSNEIIGQMHEHMLLMEQFENSYLL